MPTFIIFHESAYEKRMKNIIKKPTNVSFISAPDKT